MCRVILHDGLVPANTMPRLGFQSPAGNILHFMLNFEGLNQTVDVSIPKFHLHWPQELGCKGSPCEPGAAHTEDSRAVLERRALVRLTKGYVVQRDPEATLRPRLIQAQKMDQL